LLATPARQAALTHAISALVGGAAAV
ncbi:hypothetical protein, partial [Pseudomonas sp. NPDC089741]